MDIQASIKALRTELGQTQVDIAKALHISVGTVSRWELGLNRPNRSALAMLVEYARRYKASAECIERLKEASNATVRNRIEEKNGHLSAVEQAALAQLPAAAPFPIYVCDLETDELLYVNPFVEEQLGRPLSALAGEKCYACLQHRATPCEGCRRWQPAANSGYEVCRRADGSCYRVLTKYIPWNGHDAQVRYVFELGGSVNLSDGQAPEQ